jgi:hypothetical protein
MSHTTSSLMAECNTRLADDKSWQEPKQTRARFNRRAMGHWTMRALLTSGLIFVEN